MAFWTVVALMNAGQPQLSIAIQTEATSQADAMAQAAAALKATTIAQIQVAIVQPDKTNGAPPFQIIGV